ncbi:MAG: hypothetical protein ACRDTP_05205 [Mycobacteriales bacterium]
MTRPSPRPGRRLATPLTVLIAGVVLGVLVGAIGGAYVLSRPAVYRSTAVLMLDQEPALAKSTDDALLTKLVRLRLKYVGVVSTEVFAAPVARALGRPIGQVHAALSATAPGNGLLLDVSAQNGSAGGAHDIAQAGAAGLITYLQREETAARIPPGNQVQLSVVTPAGPGAKASPSRRRALLVGLIGFVILTAAGAVAADALRRRDT